MTTLFILLIFLLIGYTPLGFQIQIVAFDKLADCAADILHWLLLRRTWTPPTSPNPQKPGWGQTLPGACCGSSSAHGWNTYKKEKESKRFLESQSTAKRYNTYYRCDRKAPYLVVSSSALYPAREKGRRFKSEEMLIRVCLTKYKTKEDWERLLPSANAFFNISCLAWSLEIRLLPSRYSRNFWI